MNETESFSPLSSNSGFRILYLLPFAPRLDAPHGGGRVLAQFLKAISSRHSVALLMLRGANEPPIDDVLKGRCEIVEEVLRKWTGDSSGERLIRAGRLIASFFKQKPMWVVDWESQAFARRARTIADVWKPHIIQAEFGIMGQYFSALNGLKCSRILTEHEPGILAGPYLKAGPSIFRSYAHQIDKKAWQRYEPAILKQANATIVFTDKDRQALESFGLPVPVYTIPFGTELPEQPLDPLGDRPLNLLFIGNFIHSPNIEAALRLVSDIYPKVREKFPELKLYIIGDQPPQELLKHSGFHISIPGWVMDVTPYMNQASLMIAPMASGGGMRVKILEALASGKAVITTKLGAEGLQVKDREHIFLAESNQEFIELTIQLLANPDQREALARRARAWACEHLTWETSILKYEEIYRKLIDQAEDKCHLLS